MTNKCTIPEIFLRARVRELDRILSIPSAPTVTGNARVIASWPTKKPSALTVIQYRCKGVSYRVW